MSGRLDAMIADAHDRLDRAYFRHVEGKGKGCTGIVGLFSGGNDSTILAHLFRDRVAHFVHCNTTIGIEETRRFVRNTSEGFGVNLLEVFPPEGSSYRELVTSHGFPGPGHHYKMYQRLKERGLREVRRRLVSQGRSQRVIFLAGRRRAESKRRMNIPGVEVEGSVVWCSPLVDWTDDDMRAYRGRFPDVPRNYVSDMLHMSGECLCGSFATKGELEQIGFFFPDMRAEIEELQVEVRRAGIPEKRCVWGWGAESSARPSKVGRLCSSCAFFQPALWDDEVAA